MKRALSPLSSCCPMIGSCPPRFVVVSSVRLMRQDSLCLDPIRFEARGAATPRFFTAVIRLSAPMKSAHGVARQRGAVG
jgi:hypothetical protein